LPSLFWLKHEIDYIYINVASSVAIVKCSCRPSCASYTPTLWSPDRFHSAVGRKAFRFTKVQILTPGGQV